MEIMIYVCYICLVIILSLIFYFAASKIRKIVFTKLGKGLENQNKLYKALLDVAKNKKIYVYNEHMKEQYKKIFKVNKEELYHAKNVIQSDLQAEGLISVSYTVLWAFVSVSFSMLSKLTASSLGQIVDKEIDEKVINNLLVIYFLLTTIFTLWRLINTCIREKFFLCMIEDEIEDRKQNGSKENEFLKAEINTLKNEIEILKMERYSQENIDLKNEIRILKNEIEKLRVEKEKIEKHKNEFGIHTELIKKILFLLRQA